MSRRRFDPFLPSMVVAIFLFVAAYSALQIQSYLKMSSSFKSHYISYMQAVNHLHQYFIDYDVHYDQFSDGKGDIAAARIAFEGISDSYRMIVQEHGEMTFINPLHKDEHHNFIRQIGASIVSIEKLLKGFDHDTASEGDINSFDEVMHAYIDQCYRMIAEFEGEVIDSFHHNQGLAYLEQKRNVILLHLWFLFGLSCLFSLIWLICSFFTYRKNIRQQDELNLLQKCLSALDNARDAILITDEDQNIVYVNRALCTMNGLSFKNKDQMVNQAWTSVLASQIVNEVKERVVPSLRKSGYWVGEVSVPVGSGEKMETELSVTRLSDGAMVATFQDLSDKHKSEKEKKDLEEQFYQAQKMEAIGRLAGGIAHDFNNILAAMNGYAEFLVDDLDEDSEQYQFANNILLAGMQARGLTDQLLSFSRRSNVEKDVIDLVLSIDETLSMLKATLPKTIEIEREISVSRALIQGNSTQISQLLMNLCLNGVDAMEGEHGQLRLGVGTATAQEVSAAQDMPLIDKDQDDDGVPLISLQDFDNGKTRLMFGHVIEDVNYAKISVVDTGSGMSRTIMEHIFEPFFTTKPVDKSTGLGLAMVHGVVLTHKGVMVIDSTLGRGTSFEIYLPLCEDDLSGNVILPIGKDYRQEKTKKARHILVVEDQENVRDMVLKMLERLGYKTSSAASGLEGLDMIRENPSGYDLVITDQNMPSMTGIEMVAQVHFDLPEIPFIVLSGYSEEKIQEMIRGHESIKAVIRKPVSKEILSANIRAVLGNL